MSCLPLASPFTLIASGFPAAFVVRLVLTCPRRHVPATTLSALTKQLDLLYDASVYLLEPLLPPLEPLLPSDFPEVPCEVPDLGFLGVFLPFIAMCLMLPLFFPDIGSLLYTRTYITYGEIP